MRGERRKMKGAEVEGNMKGEIGKMAEDSLRK